jgi:hypothetical protein
LEIASRSVGFQQLLVTVGPGLDEAVKLCDLMVRIWM